MSDDYRSVTGPGTGAPTEVEAGKAVAGGAASGSAGDDPVVSGYAHALLGVARAEGAVERVEDELYRVARTVESNPELSQRLTDPALDTDAKLEIIEGLLAERAHPQTVSAVKFVVESGRARQLPQILDAFVALAARSRRQAVAEVRTAVALDDEQQRRLAAAIERATGQEVSLKTTVDPEVVGGVVVRVGDTVIDGSIARRLAELRSRMTGA